MSIISQETWDNMSNKEKEKLRHDYDGLIYLSEHGTDEFLRTGALKIIKEHERLFGKENLQPKPKTPKVWDDMEALHEEIDTAFVELEESLCNIDCETNLFNKILATYQIQHLIELGYGGVVTEEEWEDDNVAKYAISTCIINDKMLNIKKVDIYSYNSEKYFIAFHTSEQREEFMSYSENVKLVKQYYRL